MKSNPVKVRKGAWAHEEDDLLRKCIGKYGEGKWYLVPRRAGLNRCRKSCRLRWLNYLRPTIKRGEFAEDEVDLIIRLHNLLGNRWSLIAGRLPGRTANDVKNYWNTNLQKKFSRQKEVVETQERGENRRVIKPLPRSLIKGTTVPCYSAPNIIYSTNYMLMDHKPLSRAPPPPPDQDGIEWWNRLLDEVGITREEEVESGGLSTSGESGTLFPVHDSLALTTEHTEGGHNGWAHIWDLLSTDFQLIT